MLLGGLYVRHDLPQALPSGQSVGTGVLLSRHPLPTDLDAFGQSSRFFNQRHKMLLLAAPHSGHVADAQLAVATNNGFLAAY